MRLSLGLEARQVQVQKLAPRMIQSMEILQLPMLALQERIDQELSENPLLELASPGDGDGTGDGDRSGDGDGSDAGGSASDSTRETDSSSGDANGDSGDSGADSRSDLGGDANSTTPDDGDRTLGDDRGDDRGEDRAEGEREMVVDTAQATDDFERLLDLDREVPDYFDESPRRSVNRLDEDAERRNDAIANIESRPETLNDHLLRQLADVDLDDELRDLAERIISMLDARDGGYLRVSLRDLLPADATADQLELAEWALEVVQQLEPVGVAARSLRECLLLQLRPDMPHRELVRRIIENHLEDLRDNRLPVIQRATGNSMDQIKAAWAELRKLNPRPGARFAAAHVATVTPDIVVEKKPDGRYEVVLEDDHTPTLHISEYYRRRLASSDASTEEKEYIKRKIGAAQWLIESIEQRRNTIIKVAQAVVDYQTAFLDDGPEYIQPLKMQQIAEKVGVHVTTISRAVDDKWIQTPRGILPLRRFFVGGTQSEDGEDVAWDIIRIKLQEIVDREDKSNPLSDDDLVTALKGQGLTVARRTITKYRQKMNIPSSRQRREWASE
ncbi:MAG: RNA polymerase factor sigma-54 [Planctomycetota bacterium]